MQCGIACLAMVCKHFGREYSLDALSRICFANNEGVSLLGISEAAKSIGLETVSGRVRVDQFSNDKQPCILHWNQNHFVVLFKVSKNGKKFYVADPGKGKITYKKEEFERHWISTQSNGEGKRVALVSEYFLRYDKEPLLQGKKYGQNEQLMFGAQISVLNNKMSIFAVATIPTKVISKRCYNEILIPKYHYMTWNDDRVNNSIVQVVLRYNISKGKVSKLQYNNNNDKEK